jgi:hypothetical protein
VPKVIRSTIIDAPIEAVWGVLRDFNGHDRWHPIVAESHLEAERSPDEIGAVRNFRLRNGAQLREQLLELDDRSHSFTYCILDSPIPLIGYVAKVTLKRVTDGNRVLGLAVVRDAARPRAQLERMVGGGVRRRIGRSARSSRGAHSPPLPRGPPRCTRPRRDRRAGHRDQRHGGPRDARDGTRLAACPPGEVRLRHTAIGVNYIDVYVRTGPIRSRPGRRAWSCRAGDDVGEASSASFRRSRRVRVPLVGALYAGANDESRSACVPPHERRSRGVMLKGMTAEHLLGARSGSAAATILVHSAAGASGCSVPVGEAPRRDRDRDGRQRRQGGAREGARLRPSDLHTADSFSPT